MSTPSVRCWTRWGVCAAALVGCASQPAPQEGAPCGGLPPPFNPPIACPIPESAIRAEVGPQESGCFEIAREPGPRGGLRIQQQIVCPPFRSR